MPRYSRNGKHVNIITPEMFAEGIGKIPPKQQDKSALLILLYYSGVRVMEAMRVVKEQFEIRDNILYFNVGPREKSGLTTQPLPLSLNIEFISILVDQIKKTKKGQRVFPFSVMTIRRWCVRLWNTYPHHFRLSRITSLLQQGYNTFQVRSWTGHKSLQSLQFYMGLVDIQKMGEGLR